MQSGTVNKKDVGTRFDAVAFIFRKYGGIALIALLSAAVLWFVFYFFAEDIAKSRAMLTRLDETSADEIVFSKLPQNESEAYLDSFINFNGTHILKDGKRVNCDLLMVREGESYSDNYFGFSSSLASDECAVSANLLYEYGIKPGDELTVSGKNKTYRVAESLPAMQGIDRNYLHLGVIIIGNDKELIADTELRYLSFFKGGDGYSSVEWIEFPSKLRAATTPVLEKAFLYICMFSALVVVLWETLVGRRKYRDFRFLAELGARGMTLYSKIFATVLVKYFLPAVAVAAIWLFELYCYGASYVYPILVYLGVFLALLVLYTTFVFRRVSLCRMKKR